jgi:IS30 family transposase
LTISISGVMSNLFKMSFSAAELAEKWGVHRSTVPRIMHRFGFGGKKFGNTRQASRRFSISDVEKVEMLATFHSS